MYIQAYNIMFSLKITTKVLYLVKMQDAQIFPYSTIIKKSTLCSYFL